MATNSTKKPQCYGCYKPLLKRGKCDDCKKIVAALRVATRKAARRTESVEIGERERRMTHRVLTGN
jgi:hypothetical protein